jgi:hypothetical protein
MNPVGLVATLTAYGLLGVVLLAVFTICLVGLLLGALVALGHLGRRRRGEVDPEPDGPDAPGQGSALASFHWEEPAEQSRTDPRVDRHAARPTARDEGPGRTGWSSSPGRGTRRA